tara:strand:+ start:42 stop:2702 length:2661 start_codon:yes stop_codon:yes gene_type:complete
MKQYYKSHSARGLKGGPNYQEVTQEGFIVTKQGQYKYPGKKTRIPSNDITMKGVPYPVFAIPNVGIPIIMQSGQDYYFSDADYVDEIPMMQDGNGENEFEIPGLRNRMQYDEQGNKLYGYKSFMPRNAFGFVTPTEIDPLSKTPRGLFGAASYRFPKTDISAEGRVFQSLSQLANKGQYDPSITDVELLAKYSPKPGLSVQAGPKLTTVGLPQGQTILDPGYVLETTQSFPKLNLEGTLGLRQSFNRGTGIKGGIKYMPPSGNTFLTGEVEFDPSVFQGKQTPRVQLSATQKLGVRNRERPRSFQEMKVGGTLPKYQAKGQTYDINKIANAINKGQANTLTSDELAYYKKNYAQGNIASMQDENLYGFLPEATVYADPIKPGRQISSALANTLAGFADLTPFPAAVRIGQDPARYGEALKTFVSDLPKASALAGSTMGPRRIDPETRQALQPQGGYANELLDVSSVASLLPALRSLRAQKVVPDFNIDPLSFKSLYKKRQANLSNEIRRRRGNHYLDDIMDLMRKGKASQSDIDFIFENQLLQDFNLSDISSRASISNQQMIDNFNRFYRSSMTRDDIVGSNTFFSNFMRSFPSSIKKTKTKIRNKSGLTKDQIKERYPDINIDNISDKDFGEMYLTSDNKLVKGSTEKQLKKELKKSGVSELTPKEYQDVFNSNLNRLNQIIQKNKSSDAPFYKVLGLIDDAIVIESDFGRSAFRVNINPGKMTGQVSDIANVDYIKGLPGMSMYNTTQGVYGAGNPVIRGTRLYESLNEFLKEINLGRIKSGFSGKSEFSKGLWENLPKKNKGFTFYTNPSSIEGVMYKDGGTTAKKQINSDLLKTYKNYINGVDESEEAVKAYDKLNRIFYKESKLNNMSAPNYIMTHVIPNA